MSDRISSPQREFPSIAEVSLIVVVDSDLGLNRTPRPHSSISVVGVRGSVEARRGGLEIGLAFSNSGLYLHTDSVGCPESMFFAITTPMVIEFTEISLSADSCVAIVALGPFGLLEAE